MFNTSNKMKNNIVLVVIVFLTFLVIPLVSAGNYGAGTYGSGVFGTGEVVTSPVGGGSSGGFSSVPPQMPQQLQLLNVLKILIVEKTDIVLKVLVLTHNVLMIQFVK